jgi:hypothetical protein
VRTISKNTAVPKKAQRPIAAASNSPPANAAKMTGQGALGVEINAGIALPQVPASQIGPPGRLGNTTPEVAGDTAALTIFAAVNL